MMMSAGERFIDDNRRLHLDTSGHVASGYYCYDDAGSWWGTLAMTGDDMMAAGDNMVMMMTMEVIPDVEAFWFAAKTRQ